MASSNQNHRFGPPAVEQARRRPIPGRMANYYDTAPQTRDPNVMSDCRRQGLARPIPGRMANYLETDHSDATSNHMRPLYNRAPSVTEVLREDPTLRQDAAPSDVSWDELQDEARSAHRSSSSDTGASPSDVRVSMEEEGTELDTLQ